jgi:hypothetical protein
MYNTKYICTYNDSDVFLETDEISEEEKQFILDTLYKSDLLHIFDAEEFDEDIFDKIISDLYAKLYIIPDLSLLMECLANRFMSIDKEFGLMILFSFDYLHLTHPCVCEFLEKGCISTDNMNKLKNAVILEPL